MFRSTRMRTVLPALLTAAMAITGLALAAPGSASAMGTIKVSDNNMRPLPERICRPLTLCTAGFQMTVMASVPLSQGEFVSSDTKLVMEIWGDDAFSDDHLVTYNIPLRPLPTTLPRGVPSLSLGFCDDTKFRGADSFFYRSGDTLLLRGCAYGAKGRGFNEDNSFLDQGDELLTKLKVVDGRGKTRTSTTVKTFGRF